YGGICAALNIHDRFFTNLTRSRMSFFAIRSFGQIINRISSDIYHCDDNLPFTLNLFLASAITLLATIVVTSIGMWVVLFVMLMLVYPYYLIQKYYRYASRDLKRISSNTLSPIYTHFSETLNGLSIIRCYNATRRFYN